MLRLPIRSLWPVNSCALPVVRIVFLNYRFTRETALEYLSPVATG